MATLTNAIRLLEGMGIALDVRTYEPDEDDLSAGRAASLLGLDPGRVFKTLVASCDGRDIVLACIPGPEELDLKRLAAAMGHKRAEMVHLSEVRPLTGYVRGGVSPVGTRKAYPVVLDESAFSHERICVSAGTRGVQMLLSPDDLRRATGATVARIARKRTDA
jgi:Cys-tRNA(Pro)/Cys-tRNA(Cys) deacylase